TRLDAAPRRGSRRGRRGGRPRLARLRARLRRSRRGGRPHLSVRVLLSGYHGFADLAAEAGLAGLARELTARGLRVTVLSGDPDATTAQHGVPAAHRTRGLLGALLRADALVSGGGGLLQDATSARSLTYYLATLRAARLLGKGVALYGQSLGPLNGVGRRRVAGAAAGLPAFRPDEPSRALARELGLDDRATADAALLLAPERPAGADPNGPVLVVPRAGHPAYNQALARLARALRGEGVPVAAVGLHARHDDAEVAALARTAPGLEALSARTPDELLALLPGASYVVSARLHGCVLAAAAGVGFAALSYDPKVAGFAALLGAPTFDAPVDDANLLAAATRREPLDLAAREAQVRLAREGLDALVAALGR